VPEPRVADTPGSSGAASAVADAGSRAQHVGETPVEPARHEPRRWNGPDKKLMLWGMLFFLLLGVYAAVFVAFGVWLTT
jgi:hypothetical protein